MTINQKRLLEVDKKWRNKFEKLSENNKIRISTHFAFYELLKQQADSLLNYSANLIVLAYREKIIKTEAEYQHELVADRNRIIEKINVLMLGLRNGIDEEIKQMLKYKTLNK